MECVYIHEVKRLDRREDDPKTRDPEQVLQDVRKGFITPKRALAVYGVAVIAQGDDWRLNRQQPRTPQAA